MKKLSLTLFPLIFSAIIYCQQIGVPYRVKDKFGLSNQAGKMLITPQFDILEPHHYNEQFYFEGFIFKNSIPLSSLIFNNKIIVLNQPYNHYYLYDGLFLAIEYLPAKKKIAASSNITGTKYHLHDAIGKKVFNEDFTDISIIDDINPKFHIDDALIYTADANGKYSLVVYNKRSKKIVNTIINRSVYLDITYNFENDYTDRTITFIYEDLQKKGRKIKVEYKDQQFKVVSDEIVVIQKQRQNNSYPENDMAIKYEPPQQLNSAPISSDAEIILNIRKVDIKIWPYSFSKKIEEIRIYNELLQKDENYIVSAKGKKGLFHVSYNKFIIPVEYDEILNANFEGHNGGHVLRNGDKYGLFIYNYPNHMIIEPVFDKIPLLVDFDYFKKSAPLIKLYDDKGKLFCYADQHGKLFYAAK